MNEKTLKLLEFDIIRSEAAARALSEEAEKLIQEELPRLNREETESQKSLVSEVMDRIAFQEGEQRESLPAITRLFPKLDVEGLVLEIDEVYALGIFIRRAEALRQWLQKPFTRPDAVSGKDAAGRDIPGQGKGGISDIASALPSCAGIAAEVFKILDNE